MIRCNRGGAWEREPPPPPVCRIFIPNKGMGDCGSAAVEGGATDGPRTTAIGSYSQIGRLPTPFQGSIRLKVMTPGQRIEDVFPRNATIPRTERTIMSAAIPYWFIEGIAELESATV